MWKDYTREEQSELIMRYVDKITLKLDYRGNPQVDEVLFRESICKPCNELYDSGYIDKTDYAIIGNIGGIKLRFSEYLPLEKVYQHIFRLREFYNVGYYEGIYNYEDKVMFFNFYDNRRIVRIFPLEEYKKMNKIEKIKMTTGSNSITITYKGEGEEKDRQKNVLVPNLQAFIELVQEKVDKEGLKIDLTQVAVNPALKILDTIFSMLPTILLVALIIMMFKMQGIGDRDRKSVV